MDPFEKALFNGRFEDLNPLDWMLLRESVMYHSLCGIGDFSPRLFLLQMRMERMVSVAFRVEHRLKGNRSPFKMEFDDRFWRADRSYRSYKWKKFWRKAG